MSGRTINPFYVKLVESNSLLESPEIFNKIQNFLHTFRGFEINQLSF